MKVYSLDEYEPGSRLSIRISNMMNYETWQRICASDMAPALLHFLFHQLEKLIEEWAKSYCLKQATFQNNKHGF